MHKLDDINYIQSLDKSDMHHKILHAPEQIYKAYYEPKMHIPSSFSPACKKIKHIIICGVGGSAIAGDILHSYFNIDLPITVLRDYRLTYTDSSTLCLFVSYSGNTEETLACLERAEKSFEKPCIAAVTSGGKLKNMVDGKHLWVELPTGYPPRAALATIFFSLLKILELFTIVEDHKNSVDEVVALLMQKAAALSMKTDTELNLAKSSALQIHSKIPIIYSANPDLNGVAYRWKCQINENAKQPAFYHTFPEMNHNEIEGWESPELSKNFIPIFLRRFDEEERYNKRIEIFQKLLQEQNIKYLEFYGDGTKRNDGDIEFYYLPAIICSLVYLGDMISFYLAILNNVDPTDIKYIDYMKKNL